MSVGTICNRHVVFISPECSIYQAAKLMREYHVGNVVVVKDKGNIKIPLGMITDRDLVIEILAKEIISTHQFFPHLHPLQGDCRRSKSRGFYTSLVQHRVISNVRNVYIFIRATRVFYDQFPSEHHSKDDDGWEGTKLAQEIGASQ